MTQLLLDMQAGRTGGTLGRRKSEESPEQGGCREVTSIPISQEKVWGGGGAGRGGTGLGRAGHELLLRRRKGERQMLYCWAPHAGGSSRGEVSAEPLALLFFSDPFLPVHLPNEGSVPKGLSPGHPLRGRSHQLHL